MKTGIDISEYQGDIDYSQASKQIQFIIPRTGFALTTDKKYRRNVAEATAWRVDIPAVYHFSYALSAKDAIAEADYAMSEVYIAGLPKSTIIFYDFEYDSITYAKKKGVHIGPKEINEFTIAFCNRCLEKGYKTGIYLNNDFYKNYYYSTTLSKYSIWLADWTGGPDHPCYIQQYTSKGSVLGIKGNVDMNYIFNIENSPPIHTIAEEVIAGKWGNGSARKQKLEAFGYDYDAVQKEVNNILNGTSNCDPSTFGDSSSKEIKYRKEYSGQYGALKNLILRKGPGENKEPVTQIPIGGSIYLSGLYSIAGDDYWVYADYVDGKSAIYSGYIPKDYISKVL